VQEIRGLERVVADQAKALERLAGSEATPAAGGGFFEELRAAQAKIRELEERRAKEEATYRKQFDHMMKLEAKVKELKDTRSVSPRAQSQAEEF
jgi:ribulose kinase